MLPWIVCGVLGAIILRLLFLLLWWQRAYYRLRKYGDRSSEWVVLEEEGTIRYSTYLQDRRWLPPKEIRTRVVEKPRKPR